MICGNISKPMFFDRQVHTCTRDENHVGPHQTMPLEGSGGHLWITEWLDGSGGTQWRVDDPGPRGRKPVIACSACGLRFRPEANYLTKGGTACFHCVFWIGRMAQYINGEIMVIEGTVYSWGPEHGYGGREFSIITEDGVTTQRGLWCGGDVPPEYRSVLKDNASWATTSQRPYKP
jgi:hypothetical protein